MKKDVYVKLRTTAAERDEIMELAKEDGTVSKYLRRLIAEDKKNREPLSNLFNEDINKSVRFETNVEEFFKELITSQEDIIKSQEMENIDYFGLELLEHLQKKFQDDPKFKKEVAEVFIKSYQKYFDRFFND